MPRGMSRMVLLTVERGKGIGAQTKVPIECEGKDKANGLGLDQFRSTYMHGTTLVEGEVDVYSANHGSADSFGIRRGACHQHSCSDCKYIA